MVGDLPSSDHAKALLASPTASNALAVGGDWVARALLIAAGMSIFAPGSGSTIKRALAGSAAIELFVLVYTARKGGTP